EQLKRREAEGANGVHLVLENAPADALMRLLEGLEQQHGLSIIQATIDPAASGRVNASITLQRGGAR
ncbi:MAG: type II secretion system protein M, partial [Halothiobacillaceae bacterium]